MPSFPFRTYFVCCFQMQVNSTKPKLFYVGLGNLSLQTRIFLLVDHRSKTSLSNCFINLLSSY